MKTLSQLWSSTSSIGMDNGRQRAHSASSLKNIHALYPGGNKWTKHHTRSTPELRLYMQQSMMSGLNTTVPQSLVPHTHNSCHKPKKRKKRARGPDQGRQTCCRQICTLKLFLVILQLLLGAATSAVAFYLYFYVTESLKIRETSYWAGIPLFVAGIIGIYHCANDYENYIGNTRHFVVKATCFLLSLVCIFVCLVASTFPAIHVTRLYDFERCEKAANDCLCYESRDENARAFVYKSIGNCETLFCLVKILLISETVQCALGSIVSFWYVILLWRSKYGGIYSGIKYSPSTNGHLPRSLTVI